MIGRRARERVPRAFAVRAFHVAAHEQAVEGTNRERGGEGTDRAPRARKPGRGEEARAERAPEIVEVTADHGGRALVDARERIRAEEEVEKLDSPLDGNELMALFGRGPGPWIKPVKERLLAAVLDGELASDDKEGATLLAQELLAEGAEV